MSMREAFPAGAPHGLAQTTGRDYCRGTPERSYDPAAALDFSELRAGRYRRAPARALGSLVKAGLTPQAAAAIVGLDDVEV